jgi:hypothetical protein
MKNIIKFFVLSYLKIEQVVKLVLLDETAYNSPCKGRSVGRRYEIKMIKMARPVRKPNFDQILVKKDKYYLSTYYQIFLKSWINGTYEVNSPVYMLRDKALIYGPGEGMLISDNIIINLCEVDNNRREVQPKSWIE